MPNKPFTACLDANVLVSAMGFGGKPDEVVRALLGRRFPHVTSPFLLEEARRNLVEKLGRDALEVALVLEKISDISNLVHPTGVLSATPHAPDVPSMAS